MIGLMIQASAICLGVDALIGDLTAPASGSQSELVLSVPCE